MKKFQLRKQINRNPFHPLGVDKKLNNAGNFVSEDKFLQSNVIKIYRYLDKLEYANSFCAGSIRLSTLSACRAYESAKRGDSEEGKKTYDIDSWNYGESISQDIAGNENLSSLIEFTGGSIQNISVEFLTQDAYILCFSERLLPETESYDVGEYCIEVSNPFFVMKEITKHLESNFRLKKLLFSRVAYKGHKFRFDNLENYENGFLKSDFYAGQDEVRMYWETFDTTELQPLILNLPHLAAHFRLIGSP